MAVTPWRTGLAERPSLPLPPDRMPLMLGGRPLKRWRWVGGFAPELMLCAAIAYVGPLRVSWWAVWDRVRRTLVEHTGHGRSLVRFEDGRVRVDDGPVAIDLWLGEAAAVETVSPHGGRYIWTRKQGGVPVRGTVKLAERRHELDAFGLVDDSAGYHARRTAWQWAAGVGTTETGARVAWNLVTGIHDAPGASERTVWVEGKPREVGPVRFLPDLAGVQFGEGGELRFQAEAVRRHRQERLVVASAYEQPFGSFTGEVPGAGRLREGWGVMERHDARW